MNRAKKARLQKKGWKFHDSPQEFLGLSDREMAFIDLRVRLSRDLHQRRTKRHLTQTDLAKLIGSSQSRVAKMEAGDPSVTLDLLVRSLLALGATSRDLARAIR
jgi:DNA-binding XRE family transcriptional regulator